MLGRVGIGVRPHASGAEGLRFEPDSIPRLNARSPHCSPSSKWVPSGSTGETKAARKGIGHPALHADGSA